MTARHQRQLAKAKARRQRGRQAGHRHLPDTGPLTARWRREGHCQYDPAQVTEAIAAEGDLLHQLALGLASEHIETLCSDFRLEPESVLDLFGPDIHAAALVTLHFKDDCLYRQLNSVRRFLRRPDVREQLKAWQEVRWAS